MLLVDHQYLFYIRQGQLLHTIQVKFKQLDVYLLILIFRMHDHSIWPSYRLENKLGSSFKWNNISCILSSRHWKRSFNNRCRRGISHINWSEQEWDEWDEFLLPQQDVSVELAERGLFARNRYPPVTKLYEPSPAAQFEPLLSPQDLQYCLWESGRNLFSPRVELPGNEWRWVQSFHLEPQQAAAYWASSNSWIGTSGIRPWDHYPPLKE